MFTIAVEGTVSHKVQSGQVTVRFTHEKLMPLGLSDLAEI